MKFGTPITRWSVAVVAAVSLSSIAGCSESTTTAVDDAVGAVKRTASQTTATVQALRQSSVVKESKAFVDRKVEAGVDRDKLAKRIDKARKLGKTSPAAACVQKQLLAFSGVTGAVLACKVELIREVGSSVASRIN